MKQCSSVYIRKILLAGFLISSSLQANSFCDRNCWRSFVGGQAGIGIFTNAGQSATFPAQTVGTDEFYIYTASPEIKVPALYGGFVGAQWRNSEYDWGFAFDANYNQSSSFSVDGILTQGLTSSTENTYTYEYSMRTRQLLAQVRAEYTNLTHATPYVLAGLGVAFNQANNFTTSVNPTLSFTRNYANNNSVASCSYALGIGIDVEFVEHVTLGLGYKFSDLGKIALGQASIDTIAVAGTLSQSNLYVNQFLIQLTIIF